MLLKSLKIKNFTSFDNMGEEVDGFNHLNILIGRNNQGKSNLLRAIQFLDYNHLISFLNKIPDSNKKFDERGSIGSSQELYSIFHYKSDRILGVWALKEPIEITYVIEIDNELHNYVVKIESLISKNNGIFGYMDEYGIIRESKEPVSTLFDGKELTINEALNNRERIVYPISSSALNYDFESMKENLLKLNFKNQRAITEKLLKKIQSLSPDFHELGLVFGDYVFPPKFDGRNIDDVSKQIYEEKLYLNLKLMLKKMGGLTSKNLGSGQMQTFSLLYEIEMAEREEASIVTIDEIELHLYPALQKSVLREIQSRTNNQFFISTHSNIFVSSPLEQRIFFVRKIFDSTKVELRKTTLELYSILDDLGVKASDILQSNGVIWVEGPSDKIIIKEWLRKIDVSKEDLNQISIVFYGGILIRNINFRELLKLNRNCVVIQDSDKTSKDENLDNAKRKVIEECKTLGIHCWTTTKKEIENYFSLNSIRKFKKKHPTMNINIPKFLDDYKDIIKIITNYNQYKTSYAKEIVNLMEKNDIINNDELCTELYKIKDLINSWNR